MTTISNSAAYNKGKADALAGRPRNSDGHVCKAKYHDGYSKYKDRAKKAAVKPVEIIKDTRAYDWANDEYFESNAAMDLSHGIEVFV